MPFGSVWWRFDPDFIRRERIERAPVRIELLRVGCVVRRGVEPRTFEQRRLRDRMRKHRDTRAWAGKFSESGGEFGRRHEACRRTWRVMRLKRTGCTRCARSGEFGCASEHARELGYRYRPGTQ